MFSQIGNTFEDKTCCSSPRVAQCAHLSPLVVLEVAPGEEARGGCVRDLLLQRAVASAPGLQLKSSTGRGSIETKDC